jgi:hypothetical protein
VSDDITIPRPTYRVPRHTYGLDPATRKLALIAAGIGGGLLVVLGGWSMLGHHHGGVPVVQADSSPLKVKPANPGGLQVAGAGNEIFSGGSDTDVHHLAPPPETPDPQGLRAPPPKPEPALEAHAGAPIIASQPPAVVQAPPAAGAVKPMVAAAVLSGRPATGPAAAEHGGAAADHGPAAVEHGTAAIDHGVAGKNVVVQLAALSSEPAAKAEWVRMVKRWPELFGGHQPAISKTERAGQVFWRVRTGGFDGLPQASQFCERLRAKGGGCSVADF